MSNPYLTMYGYDESGDSMEHAWLNKAKEKEYNHQYYLRNRNRLLAEKRRMRGPSKEGYYRLGDERGAVNKQISENERNARRASSSTANNLLGTAGRLAAYTANPANIVKDVNYMFGGHKRKTNYETMVLDPVKEARRDADRARDLREQNAKLRAYDKSLADRQRKVNVARGQAQNAYNEAVARQRKAIRQNAQEEARAKIAEANTFPNRLKREARKLSYKVGTPIARSTEKLRKKATEVMDKAKAAFEKAKNKYRAIRGAGGVGAAAGNAAKAAMNRAKELYQKAKDKVKKYSTNA